MKQKSKIKNEKEEKDGLGVFVQWNTCLRRLCFHWRQKTKTELMFHCSLLLETVVYDEGKY